MAALSPAPSVVLSGVKLTFQPAGNPSSVKVALSLPLPLLRRSTSQFASPPGAAVAGPETSSSEKPWDCETCNSSATVDTCADSW